MGQLGLLAGNQVVERDKGSQLVGCDVWYGCGRSQRPSLTSLDRGVRAMVLKKESFTRVHCLVCGSKCLL